MQDMLWRNDRSLKVLCGEHEEEGIPGISS